MSPKRTLTLLSAGLLSLGLASACSDDSDPTVPSMPDTGPAPDAGNPADSGTPDTGDTPPPDAGMMTPDTGAADTTPPTVAITKNAGSIARREVTFTFNFSEDVGSSFAIEDITVVGGTPGTFTVLSGQMATLVVAPPAEQEGTITVTVAAMSFEDLAGNANVDAVTIEQRFNTNPAGAFDGVVFGDDYGNGVTFAAFGGSNNDLSVDTGQAQAGLASLRVQVPGGDYTGGALIVAAGVDLSAFNAVSFWVRADAARTLNVTGIGNDATDTTFNTEVVNLPVDSTWRQYIIPIPDASVLSASTGLFHFAEGSDEGVYNIWLDEIEYVTLPANTFTNPRPAMNASTEAVATGGTATVNGASLVVAVNGADVTLQPMAPAFLNYTSSDTAIATVDTFGVITGVAEGTATVTADLGGTPATGSVTVNVGPGCGPMGSNLANNGGFETGGFDCVQQFLNGGMQSVVTTNPATGTYAARLTVTTQDVDTVLKFANLTPGAFTPGQTIHISFDMRGAVTPGGVVFAEFFSEITGGGTSSAEILLGGGPIFPDADPATWNNFRTTALTGSDTSGGITLQLKAASGAGTADVYFDNVCVSTSPCP